MPRENWMPIFAGKTVLITGAGGFIGSVLAREIAALPIRRLILLDNSEHGLYLLEQALSEVATSTEYSIVVGSVGDRSFLRDVFERHTPQVVFHAAALKHVQLMEDNPFAAIDTNALATQRIAQMAVSYRAEQLVLVSTDKAVDPISIMGASKRIAELILLADHSPTEMKVLRLCNVLGSTGSVAPLFEEQFRRGQAATVTHKEATRFFLSIEQTVECLLRVASVDAARFFIPVTDASYRIEELARYVAKKCLADPGAIVYTGLRTADKVHEELMSARERVAEKQTDSAILAINSAEVHAAEFAQQVEALEQAVEDRDLVRLLEATRRIVPEYAPGESFRKLHHGVAETP